MDSSKQCQSPIVTTLLPPQPFLFMEISTTTAEEVELVTDREILLPESIKDKKASGPDGIPNKALKTAIENNVGAFVDIYNSCLTQGTFPAIWKRQRLEDQTKIRLLIVPYVC